MVLSGWQIKFVFIGHGFVSFHSDFLAQFCSFINLYFHFVGDSALFKFWWVRIFFADCESFYCEYNFARWVWSFYQSRKSAFRKCAQHSVHPTGGSLRVFRQFAWLGVGSVKMAFSRPTHQRVTPAVGLQLSAILSAFVIIYFSIP